MAPPHTPDRIKILQALHTQGPHTNSALAMLCKRSRQATSRLLNRMADDGLIQRLPMAPAWCLTIDGHEALHTLKNNNSPG